MALNWNTVKAEHVARACQELREQNIPLRSKTRGISILFEGEFLPAKQVIRLAYLIANDMPLDTKLKFTSGESTVTRLRKLGFEVERRGAARLDGVPQASA